MKKILLLLPVFVILILAGCKKEKSYFPQSQESEVAPPPPSNTQEFSFSKLEAIPDTIDVGDYSDIYATATGGNLTYTWYIGHGDLFGSGYHIECGAQSCCIGTHQIKCTVSDGVHSEVKYVWITIKNPD